MASEEAISGFGCAKVEMPSGHVDGATGRRLNRRVWTTGSEPGNLGVMFRSLCEPKSQRKREKETLGHCHLRAVEKIMSRRLEKQARLECWRLVYRNPSKSHRVLHAEGGSRGQGHLEGSTASRAHRCSCEATRLRH